MVVAVVVVVVVVVDAVDVEVGVCVVEEQQILFSLALVAAPTIPVP